jgi:hypothetical protein
MPGGFINLAHLFAQPYLVHAAQVIEQNARVLVLKNHFGAMNVPTYQTHLQSSAMAASSLMALPGPGAASVDKATLQIGAVAFIHRFGSSLNGHVHFHVCVVDGVFEEVAVEGEADAQSSPPGIVFHPASAIDETAVAQVQTDLRRRILRAFVGRGLLKSCDAKEMQGYQHSGFSVDAGVCIEAQDRAAQEWLLRYCARPPFAMDRLRKEGAALVYRCAKQHSEPGSDKRGAKVDELHLTPLELIARIAALVPPPRTHRHRYFGVLAPNSPLRAAVTALAQPPTRQTEPANMSEGEPGGSAGPCDPTHARTCDTQTLEGALPVGRADRPHLRSVPAAVPAVRWADAPDRVHYRGRANQEDS